jgi:RNA polymerase sigma-70 factor (ECF subfamily)
MLSRTDDWAASQQKEQDKSYEQDLLQRICSGDRNASWELLCRHVDLLFRCCLRILDGHKEEAHDALSQIFLKAYKVLPLHGCKIRNPSAWLVRFAQNLCLDLRRKRIANRKMECGLMFIESVSTGCIRSPEQLLLEHELDAQIHTAIDTLPPRLRRVARMRFIENHPYVEIAQRLAITQANARKRIQQARNILTQRIGHYLTLGGNA